MWSAVSPGCSNRFYRRNRGVQRERKREVSLKAHIFFVWVGEGGRADIEVAQLVGLVTADRLLDVGKAGAMVHICEAGRERLVGLVRIGLRGSR